MPRKTGKYKPPFLYVTMQAEGDTLLTVNAPKPAAATAANFAALIRTHPQARKVAIAITLLEISRALLGDEGWACARLSEIVSNLVLDELPMQDFSIPDDFPF